MKFNEYSFFYAETIILHNKEYYSLVEKFSLIWPSNFNAIKLDIQTTISYPGLFTLLFIALSITLVYIVYFFKKIKEEFNQLQRYLLSGIKFLYVLLIAILLLAPIIEILKNNIEKPILIVGVDNSESMKAEKNASDFVNQYIEQLKTILDDKFQVETLLFGSEITNGDSAKFTELKSNYSSFINELEKRYFNLNVGAIVLIGDGIYNEGKNPEQSLDKINAPIYSLGIGDTLVKVDQAIIDVTNNPNVFLGNSFPVEVELTFNEFPESNTQLAIYLDGKLVKSEKINIPQPNYYYSTIYNINATNVGLKNVSVVLSPNTLEQNTKNNRYNFTIEVHDNKKKLLILSQGPNPDIGAITETLDKQANFNITTKEILHFNGKLMDYDLVILNQLPSLMTQQSDLFNEIKNSKLPLFIIIGPKTSIPALNNLNLNFSLTPSLINEESTPYFNSEFSLFNFPSNIKDVEKIYPPLLTHYTEYTVGSEYAVLAYQQIKGIKLNYPLIMTGDINNRKIGVIMGEGIWRWRFREFQNYDNQNTFNQLIVSLFNYLCIKEDREQFKVLYERIASETTPIKIKAQVFNELFEAVNNAEINLMLKDSSGSELSYLFDVNQTEYNLDLGFLSPGNYSFETEARLGDKIFQKSGSFSVQEVNIEQQNLQSNFNTLAMLSNATSGKFFLKNQSEELIQLLKDNQTIKSKVHKEKNIHELIDWKGYILLILLLVSLEWFLRKFWGSY